MVTTRGRPCIADFGLSRLRADPKLQTASASVRWLAPELCEGLQPTATTSSDVYQFGMTCLVHILRFANMLRTIMIGVGNFEREVLISRVGE